MIKKLFNKKFIIFFLLIIIVGGYFAYRAFSGKEGGIRYTTAAAKIETLISSISGSGQVSTSNQVDVKSKVAGEVIRVDVKDGQKVKTDALIVQLDAQEAQKSVRDAEISLESAKLALEKIKESGDTLSTIQAENALKKAQRDLEELLEPPDAYDLLQAENALQQAKDNLVKLELSQEIDYQKAREAKQKAEDDIKRGYENSFNTITDAFLDLPTVTTGLNDILYSKEIAENEFSPSGHFWNNTSALKYSVDYDDQYKLDKLIKSAEDDYKTAREKYDKNFENYKETRRYSGQKVIKLLLRETIETVKAIAEAVKSEANLLDYWVDCRSKKDLKVFDKVTEYQSDLKTYTSKINSYLSNFLTIQNTIEDNEKSKLDAERDLQEMDQNNPIDILVAENDIKEKEKALLTLKAGADTGDIKTAREKVREEEEALARIKAGADALDIQSQELTIEECENALLDAKDKLDDYYIRAPLDGTIVETNVNKGESISSSTVVATLITDQKLAEILLNEIDAAKADIGQKATLTFDAFPDMSISGKVVEVDLVGAVTNGVVEYGVKITFDTQDKKIKSGMSVTADIITDIKQDVLVLPNSAIKSEGESRYVELIEADNQIKSDDASGVVLGESFQKQAVGVGLSNDLSTEIVSGLKENDIVVISTINSDDTEASPNQGFRMPAAGGMKSF